MTADDFPPPTDEELRESEALARALDEERPEHELAELADVLRAAWEPSPIERGAHDHLVKKALGRPTKRPRNALLFGGGAAVALAAAAALSLFLSDVLRREGDQASAVEVRAVLVLATSTESLFHEPYGASRGSDRIDRIARVRASDFRENRFRGWGVR